MICEYCGKSQATHIRSVRTFRGEEMVSKKFHRCDGCREVHMKAQVIGYVAALLVLCGVTLPTILHAEVLAEAIGLAYLPRSVNILLKTLVFLVAISSPVITYVGAIWVYQRKFHPDSDRSVGGKPSYIRE